MNKSLFILLCLSPLLAFAQGKGHISGKVKLITEAVASRPVTPADVIIFLEDAPNTGTPPLPKGPFEMSQAGKTFEPSVLIVPKGATVQFPNLDPILHNVFSVTPGNSFDLGLHAGGGESPHATMTNAGIVSVYCNIHPQMVGYLVVVSNPYFTHARADGTFELNDLPPGTYHAVAWFPFGAPTRQEVTVTAGGTTKTDFVVRERADAGRHLKKDGSRYGAY